MGQDSAVEQIQEEQIIIYGQKTRRNQQKQMYLPSCHTPINYCFMQSKAFVNCTKYIAYIVSEVT